MQRDTSSQEGPASPRSSGALLLLGLVGHLLAYAAWHDDVGPLAGLFVLPAGVLATLVGGVRGALLVTGWAVLWHAALGANLPLPDGRVLGLARTVLSFRFVLGHLALGGLLYVLGRQRDLRRALEQSQEELAQTRTALTAAEKLREEARLTQRLSRTERMASIGTLAAGVAHEVNNPLTYVIGNLYYAIEEIDRNGSAPESLKSELTELLRDALDGAERVRRIVRDLKTFARATEDEPEQPIDVNAVIGAAVNLVNNEIRHRARLSLVLSDVPRVLGSESKLVQAFVNLLMNAAQAIPEGRADSQLVEVRSMVDGYTRVRIEFRDTGVGMSEEVLSRVFEPFFTTKPATVGTGIGLSVAHGIVQAMGGEITVTSREQHGTTFSVLLPIDPSATLGQGTRRSPLPARMRKLRVLVIDDEPKVGVSLRRMLRDWDVVVIEDGRDALDMMAREPNFDAVLCDLMMPHVTGMDLYAEAQKVAPGLATRFVFMTGGAFTPRARAFIAEVPNTTLEKPFEKAHVLAAVEAALGGHGARPKTTPEGTSG